MAAFRWSWTAACSPRRSSRRASWRGARCSKTRSTTVSILACVAWIAADTLFVGGSGAVFSEYVRDYMAVFWKVNQRCPYRWSSPCSLLPRGARRSRTRRFWRTRRSVRGTARSMAWSRTSRSTPNSARCVCACTLPLCAVVGRSFVMFALCLFVVCRARARCSRSRIWPPCCSTAAQVRDRPSLRLATRLPRSLLCALPA